MGFFKKIIHKIWSSIYSRAAPLSYAKAIGVNIADDVEILGKIGWGTEPYLIHIGPNTRITNDVVFITHDGAIVNIRRCFSDEYRNVVKFGSIHIGKNCFIGTRSTIMPDVFIGDNSIVGACSLVTKSIPPNEVWGGVPAKRICSIQEYADKLLEYTPDYEPFSFKDKKRAIEIVKKIAYEYHELKNK